MRKRPWSLLAIYLLAAAVANAAEWPLWDLARTSVGDHRFSVLFTARGIPSGLATREGTEQAIKWCKQTGITKVYLEAFGDGVRPSREALLTVAEAFRGAGFQVAGCITTTKIGKQSTGWGGGPCFTSQKTQEEIRGVFEFATGIFNEIIVNDFLLATCTDGECDTARRSRTVRIGETAYPVETDRWEDYRRELITRISERVIISAVKRVNPRAKVILKYPHYYDHYQERGLDPGRLTRLYDGIWVGTETRDRNQPNERLQYGAYFLMRWLSGIGGPKAGGGWYDSRRTQAKIFLEQARQTVLGGAPETILNSYEAFGQDSGPDDISALRSRLPELLEVAGVVRKRTPLGVAAYKPLNSNPDDEPYIFDYVGMLGIPLAPCHEFPTDAKAAFFSMHALEDSGFTSKLESFIASGKPVLLSSGLARRLSGKVALGRENVQVLRYGPAVNGLLKLTAREIDEIRKPLLAAFGVSLQAPPEVSLYPFSDGSWVVENFSDRPVNVTLNGEQLMVGAREWAHRWQAR